MNSIKYVIRSMLAAVLSSCLMFEASAAYKWKDTNGVVYYGDKPPKDHNFEEITKQKVAVTAPNSIQIEPVPVEISEMDGITRYALLTDEKINQYSQWPVQIDRIENKLWLNFENSMISYDLNTHTSKKYRLDNIQKDLSTQSMQITDDSFIFLTQYNKPSQSSFHIYNYVTNIYKTLALKSMPHWINRYEDKYNDGVFVFDYDHDAPVQYQLLKKSGEINSIHETKFASNGNRFGAITSSENAIWQVSGKGMPCSVSRFNKKGSTVTSFNHKAIGLPSTHKCGWIVTDNDEVWVATIDEHRTRFSFAIYSIKSETWQILNKSKNDAALNYSPLHLDNQYIYYTSCEKLIAMNRKSKIATTITTDGFNIPPSVHYCINDFTTYKDNAWIFKLEKYKHKIYPMLYKLPLHKLTSAATHH